MRRAKVICTLGPATDTEEQIRSLVDAGMDVARFNLSHGTYAEHERRYAHVRRASDHASRAVGVLVDLQGPKIRLGTSSRAARRCSTPGRCSRSRRGSCVGTAEIASTTYTGLPGDVRPGDRLLVDDGRLNLEVVQVSETDVVTRVIEGGPVSDNKGLNLPGRRGQRAGPVGEGRRGPALGAAPARGPDRAVVRAQRPRHRAGARGHGARRGSGCR